MSARAARIAKLADDKTVFWLDLNESFLDDSGRLSKDIMPDFLHPNEKGYQIWAEAMDSGLAFIPIM